MTRPVLFCFSFILHASGFLKAKEVIQMLGAALDGGYLDAEASKFLDLSMIAYVSETNNLKPLQRCVLCTSFFTKSVKMEH